MHYSQAPLPFTGQKRNFLKFFQQVLKENISNQGQGWTIIDAVWWVGFTGAYRKANAA